MSPQNKGHENNISMNNNSTKDSPTGSAGLEDSPQRVYPDGNGDSNIHTCTRKSPIPVSGTMFKTKDWGNELAGIGERFCFEGDSEDVDHNYFAVEG
jgi:hypothetical protein